MFEHLGEMRSAAARLSVAAVVRHEEHVRELLGGAVEFEQHAVSFCEPSPDSYADFMLASFPPLIAARVQVGDELVRNAFLDWAYEVNEADDGTLRFRGEYLVSVTLI